jgi:hypothetical protein
MLNWLRRNKKIEKQQPSKCQLCGTPMYCETNMFSHKDMIICKSCHYFAHQLEDPKPEVKPKHQPFIFR